MQSLVLCLLPFFLAVLPGFGGLSSLTRNGSRPPAAEAWCLNHLDCQGSLTFLIFFLTSILSVLASFPGPPSLRATDFQLRRKTVSFPIASEKVQGQPPIGLLSLDEPIWALYPPQKLEGVGREWAEIGRMVPQRKVVMQLLEGYSKIHGWPCSTYKS